MVDFLAESSRYVLFWQTVLTETEAVASFCFIYLRTKHLQAALPPNSQQGILSLCLKADIIENTVKLKQIETAIVVICGF